MTRDPFRFRSTTLTVEILGHVYDTEPTDAYPWDELVTTIAHNTGKTWKTIENALYELAAFGALHLTGRPRDRLIRPTPLGQAWLEQELIPRPGQHADLDDVDALAEAALADLNLDSIITNLGHHPRHDA